MRPFVVRPALRVSGRISLPGDKSITHRAAILSAISCGKTTIKNFPNNLDCLATIVALRKLGVKIEQGISLPSGSGSVIVRSDGLFGLKKPKSPVFVNESGTTIRLLAGLLAGQSFDSRLVCGKALSRRPMRRVCEPLRAMGAVIGSRVTPRLGSTSLTTGRSGQEGYKTGAEEYPPLVITGSVLHGVTYKMPIASAQVKSAILLAGLYARGKTSVIEPVASRDHTERMMKLFGAGIKSKAGKIILTPGKDLVSPQAINVPADISSAVFFVVLATLIPGSLLELTNVSLNPLRAGAIKVLKRMGADITVQRLKQDPPFAEPAGDIFVRGAGLKGTTINKEEIPSLIDELPILMVAAARAGGRTVIKGAQELRFKETDRINAMSYNLKKMGAKLNVRSHTAGVDIIIDGVQALSGAKLKCFGDHRTAMSMCVAGAVARSASVIDDVTCINKSFPGFIKAFKSVV